MEALTCMWKHSQDNCKQRQHIFLNNPKIHEKTEKRRGKKGPRSYSDIKWADLIHHGGRKTRTSAQLQMRCGLSLSFSGDPTRRWEAAVKDMIPGGVRCPAERRRPGGLRLRTRQRGSCPHSAMPAPARTFIPGEAARRPAGDAPWQRQLRLCSPA